MFPEEKISLSTSLNFGLKLQKSSLQYQRGAQMSKTDNAPVKCKVNAFLYIIYTH